MHRCVARDPTPAILPTAPECLGDVQQNLEGAIVRLVRHDRVDGRRYARITGANAEIAQRGEGMERVAGIVVAFQRVARPPRHFGDELSHARVVQYLRSVGCHLRVGLWMLDQIDKRPVPGPGLI